MIQGGSFTPKFKRERQPDVTFITQGQNILEKEQRSGQLKDFDVFHEEFNRSVTMLSEYEAQQTQERDAEEERLKAVTNQP